MGRDKDASVEGEENRRAVKDSPIFSGNFVMSSRRQQPKATPKIMRSQPKKKPD